MAKPSKPVHLIKLFYGYECRAVCDTYFNVKPLEATIVRPHRLNISKGTFDPEEVTCKRCLKSGSYKTAMDRLKYPLFFLGK